MRNFLKWFLIVVSIIIVSLIILFFTFKNQITRIMITKFKDTQVENQYDKEKKTSAKRELNFQPFKEDMEKMSKERYNEISSLVLESNIDNIQKNLQENKLTSEELVTFYLKRIQDRDVNKLNSIIELNPDAINIARKFDEERKNGNAKSDLYGIPIVLKDNIGTADKMHNTAGAKALENATVKEDSDVVKNLRAKGAIILAKANLSEWANYMTEKGASGYSALGGQTHDPYGKFDVGGSSSGSAASVADNLAAASFGTETAGSIVYPSSQNSVVGIRPSTGVISGEGVIPLAEIQDTVGPIGRNVEDAAKLLYSVTTLNEYKNFDYKKILDKNGLKGMKIGIVNNIKIHYLKGDEEILDRVKKELESAGAEVKLIELDKKAQTFNTADLLKYGFKQDVEKYLRDKAENANVKTLADLIKFNKQDLANNAIYGQSLIEKSEENKMTKEQYDKNVVDLSEEAKRILDEPLKDVDVLMTLSNYMSNIYPIAGYPAMTVPAGYRENGEPIGITFVGGKFQDDKLIKAGYSYQEFTKHRKAPIE